MLFDSYLIILVLFEFKSDPFLYVFAFKREPYNITETEIQKRIPTFTIRGNLSGDFR